MKLVHAAQTMQCYGVCIVHSYTHIYSNSLSPLPLWYIDPPLLSPLCLWYIAISTCILTHPYICGT